MLMEFGAKEGACLECKYLEINTYSVTGNISHTSCARDFERANVYLSVDKMIIFTKVKFYIPNNVQATAQDRLLWLSFRKALSSS